MLTLYDFLNTTTLHKGFDISIHSQWLGMFTLFQQTQPINISCDTNNVPCNNINEEGFEKKQENRSIGIMVQNILFSQQNYDYFQNAIIVAPSQDFKPFWVISKMFIVKN